MDVKLESLIEKIQKEGVQQAEEKADQIIKGAKDKEKEIIAKATKEAEKIKEEAKKEADQFVKNGKNSIQQAARNVILSVKEKLTSIFDNILKQELTAAMGPENVAKMLEKIIDKWSGEKEKGLEFLVNKKDKQELEKLILAKFKEKAKKTIEIKASDTVEKGFQVGIKGEDTYYDFSDQGITESLSVFLNPTLAELISDKKNG
ncbi:MAG: hypothetical protein K9L61_01900 [Candidatus Omnitrophica bacterium]|nr:hypothetical protein [Candidatus Omnitrophota bacterium]